MKLIFNKIIAILLIVLICNENILALKNEISSHKSHHKKSMYLKTHHSSNRIQNKAYNHFHKFSSSSSKVNTRKCEDKDKFNFVKFFIGVKNGVSHTIIGKLTEIKFEDTAVHADTTRCLEGFKSIYEGKLVESTENAKLLVEGGFNDQLKFLEDLGITNEEKSTLQVELTQNNPQKLCKEIQNILKSKNLDNADKEIEKKKKMLKYFEEKEFTDIISLDELKSWAHLGEKNWLGNEKYETRRIFYLILQGVERNHPELKNNYYDLIMRGIEVIGEHIKVAQEAKMNIQNIKNLHCDDFPTNQGDDEKCFHNSMMTKIISLWKALKEIETKQTDQAVCVAAFLTEAIAKKLWKMSLSAIGSFLANILGMVLISVIKAVYYGIIMINKIKEAIKFYNQPGKGPEYSQAIGEAVGLGFKVVGSIVGVVKRRKLRRFRRIK
jgi:hypothetical protein